MHSTVRVKTLVKISLQYFHLDFDNGTIAITGTWMVRLLSSAEKLVRIETRSGPVSHFGLLE